MNYADQIRRGIGAIPFGGSTLAAPKPSDPPLAPPTSPESIALYHRNAFTLHTVESASRTDAKHYGIAAAIAFSLGASIALSAADRRLQLAGSIAAGAGAGAGAIALRSHFRAREAAALKNRYVRALVAVGEKSTVPITEGA